MKHAAIIAALISLPCMAAERLLGTIVSGAGADTTNATTAAPFAIKPGSKLTIQCNAAANICANSSTACTALAGSNSGVEVSAKEKFPTSAGSGDLTTTSGAQVSPPRQVVVAGKPSVTFRIFGPAAVSCVFWAREGDE